jgi:hypothetical protein
MLRLRGTAGGDGTASLCSSRQADRDPEVASAILRPDSRGLAPRCSREKIWKRTDAAGGPHDRAGDRGSVATGI